MRAVVDDELETNLARVHNKSDPVDGDRGLCYVGGHNALSDALWGEVKYLTHTHRTTGLYRLTPGSHI